MYMKHASEGSGVNGLADTSCADNQRILLQKAMKGNSSAFEKLMNEYLKILYNYIRMHVYSKEDIKDILQDAMLGIWQGLGGFEGSSSFKTWIIGITRRKIADYYRKSYKNKDVDILDISEYDSVIHTDDNTEHIADKLSVCSALKTLNGMERELVFLVFNAQLTYKQIEQATGIPNGTIKSRMAAIKAKLKKELTKGGI